MFLWLIAGQPVSGEPLPSPQWCQWLQDQSVIQTVRESTWVFPTLEWIHIYSMVFLITVIAALDLRLMGFQLDPKTSQPLSQLARRVLRLAWISLGVNAITGTFLFASKAPDYYVNVPFRIKLLLVALGVVYHSVVLPILTKRDEVPSAPTASKLAGALSLLLWIGVIAASRWIAFV